jgi:FemAB-related protein (PEP-CTERM system-associated)
MSLLIVRPFNGNGEEWDTYAGLHPEGTNYHLYGWRGIIEKSFGHTTHYLTAVNERDKVKGILPLAFMQSILFGRFLVSLPFFNYGGLLCDNDTVGKMLLDEAKLIQKELNAGYIELRHMKKHGNELSTKQHKVTMILDLQNDIEAQWKAFNSKLRNQIRKATKSGLSITTGGTELLDGFYGVFSINMRDLGTPVYSRNFFSNILAAFPENSKIFSVFLNGKVIASGLASWHKDNFEIPWASSIAEFKPLCPNNLLYWEAIRYAITNRFKTFDFGRSTPGEGTYKFKEQWGAQAVPLYWQYHMPDGKPLPELNTKNKKYEFAIKIWQKLPVPFTRLLGPAIVKNIP